MKRSSLFTTLAVLALTAACALMPDVAMAATHGVGHAASSLSFTDVGSLLLAAGPSVMKFQVREGFVASTSQIFEQPNGQKEVRTNQYWAGEVVELTEQQAIDNLHKLEPKDKAAAELVASKTTKVSEILEPAGVAEQVAAAVASALASFTAGLVSAGILPPAAPAAAAPAAAGGKGGAS